MPRPPGVQITRNRRKDGSTTYALRVRIQGTDERIPLGNTEDGWDEIRVDQTRKQLLAKIELGQWSPRHPAPSASSDEEPTFRELATHWLDARRRNPAIRPATIQNNEWQLTRYLAPFFGELRPSEITTQAIKDYQHWIHRENEQIRQAAEAGAPLRDTRNGLLLRTLGNDSINKSLHTLAMVLDDAEDAGWIERNAARSPRVRAPAERRRRHGTLEVDEFLDLLDAADQLDRTRHSRETLQKASLVRVLRDELNMPWKKIAARVGVAETTAIYLHGCIGPNDDPGFGVRRAIIATLGLAGPRVSELCQLDNQDLDLTKARFHIRDSKTEAGIRTVDIHPRLLDELTRHFARRGPAALDAPAFPTRNGTRRDKDNVRTRVVAPVVARANEIRQQRNQPQIRLQVTPHTFRRTYITFLIAAGHDLPYVQAQVGHANPALTLSVYAQVMRRPDRDELREEIRGLLNTPGVLDNPPTSAISVAAPSPTPLATNLRSLQKAGRGRSLQI
jgi:integrase